MVEDLGQKGSEKNPLVVHEVLIILSLYFNKMEWDVTSFLTFPCPGHPSERLWRFNWMVHIFLPCLKGYWGNWGYLIV